MKECRDCKRYRKCTRNHEWFSYADIRFCPFQILWIIERATTFLAGNWPDNPDGSTYIDPSVIGDFRNEAYYVKPEVILAEVEYRLKRAGVEGKLLRSEIKAGETMDTMQREARSALLYIKGWRRKGTSYEQWKASRNYYITKTK